MSEPSKHVSPTRLSLLSAIARPIDRSIHKRYAGSDFITESELAVRLRFKLMDAYRAAPDQQTYTMSVVYTLTVVSPVVRRLDIIVPKVWVIGDSIEIGSVWHTSKFRLRSHPVSPMAGISTGWSVEGLPELHRALNDLSKGMGSFDRKTFIAGFL